MWRAAVAALFFLIVVPATQTLARVQLDLATAHIQSEAERSFRRQSAWALMALSRLMGAPSAGASAGGATRWCCTGVLVEPTVRGAE